MPRSEPTPESACAICDSTSSRLLYDLSNGRIVQCRSCGTVSRCDLIAGDAADELYADRDYLESAYFAVLKEDIDKSRQPFALYDQALDRLGRPDAGARLLDVGCSYGAFLEMARERGWDTLGVELSAEPAEYCRRERGLEVHTGTLEEASFPDGEFSVVTLWDVIEHLDRPVDTLREIRRILAPDGVAVLFTINQKSLFNRVGHWIYRLSFGRIAKPMELLYDEHHNFFFDTRTMRKSLELAGLESIQDPLWSDANISRWHSVEIPKPLAIGSDVLDVVARLVNARYRMTYFASP